MSRLFQRGVSAGVFLLVFAMSAASQTVPRRVLIIHSFGPNASPYHAVASALQSTLARESGESLDMYHASLDADRFAEPQMQDAFAEFLKKRFAGIALDLIVPIGSPSAIFVMQYRELLFPATPIVFTATDPRLIRPQHFPNSTSVRQDNRLSRVIEDILQLAPDTTNIQVVFGDSQLERFWTDVCRREFQKFNDRIRFVWLNGLSLDQIEKQVSSLPPHSFVMLGLLIRDAAGVTYDANEPLRRLRATANAPVYGLFQSQMGQGIVGGRLIQDQTIGVEAARIALRILNGEVADRIPEAIVETPFAAYDWRGLRRWGISEARLPPGSSILFRQPTFWQRYRWYIAAVISFCLFQTLLIVALLTNLMRRRRVERSLKVSEERYHRLFEAESDALLLKDAESGQILDANTAAERVYGYSRDELLRLKGSDLSAEPERTKAAMAAGETHVTMRMHRRKDGTIFPVELSAGHFHDHGRRFHIVAIRDITDRVSAEEKLRTSEEKYRRLYESMMDAYVMVDLEGRIREFNPAYQQLLGYTDEELRHLTFQEITPVKWHDFEAQIISDQVLTRGYSDIYEKQYLRKDGTVFPVELRCFLTRDAEGNPEAMWAIVRDITQRKSAEQALQRGEERFRNVAEAVSDFIWEVDADGLYRYASPSVEKILGYSPDEMIGKMHFYDLFAPDRREQLKTEAFGTFAARKAFHSFLNPNISKTGNIIYLQTSGTPIFDEAGDLLGYRGADNDVTKRHLAEMEAQLLRQEMALFSRAATVGELTASLAHELYQPLAAILSNAEAALRLMEAGEPDLKELHAIFHDIVADDRRAAEVIRSLRSMFRKGEADRQPLLLNDLITNVLAIVRSDAIKRNVSLAVDSDLRAPSIMGDRVQLQQVILNLLVNAFEAMETSEPPRALVLRTRETNGEIVLDVVDSGTGIPADKLDTLFEPFVTTKATGLGMGLSLSRSIMMAHNGRIWAENNPDRGATFHMALPLENALAAAIGDGSQQARRSDTGHLSQGFTVLVADDREPFRHAVRSLLADLPGLQLLAEAADGTEAVEKAVQLEPDLILLDVGLPKMNGIDAAARIHAVVPNSRILFLSQYDSPDFIRAALRTGAVGYVLKVDAATELLTAATTALRGHQYLSTRIRNVTPASGHNRGCSA